MIPRLVDSAGQAAPPGGGGGGVGGADLDPTNWSVEEVSTFLEINECSTLAGAFCEQVLCQVAKGVLEASVAFQKLKTICTD